MDEHIGPLTCVWVPADKKWFCYPPKSKRVQLMDKRDGSWTCFEAADGQVHCIPKRTNIQKRESTESADWCCWEAADGQVHCVVCKDKRDDSEGIVERGITESAGWCCWEATDGQIHCRVCKERRNDSQEIQDRGITESADWCCWEATNGQIHCRVCKDKRNNIPELTHFPHTSEPACYHHGEDDISCLHEKRVVGKSSTFPSIPHYPSSSCISILPCIAIYVSPTPFPTQVRYLK